MVPMLVNHLWQSTVFAAVVALLTLALRTNHARTRYWLWLAASLKFLIPFSILVTLGKYLGAAFVPHGMQRTWMLVTDEISRPFPQAMVYGMPADTIHLALFNMRLTLGAIWLCGFAGVLYSWAKKWRKVSATARAAMPLCEGREFQALRRLEQTTGIATRVQLASSAASLEPGVFGIMRPVLILPAGIADHLSDAQLEAIFAHELCHLRWRDNLSAAVHMFIEAVFWFHPMVWWLGARLVDERERACDEDVLLLGSEPSVYAESILRTCKFYLESPLACVAGITGSNLKRRIEGIMMHRPSLRLNLGRKVLLCTAAVSALAAPVVIGVLNAPLAHSGTGVVEAFDVASVTPNTSGGHQVRLLHSPDGRLSMTNTTLKELITFAYDLRDHQISGAPDWLSTVRYDITAKAAGSLSRDELRRATKTLLADRFRLAAHLETKELPVYELLAGNGGPMLHESASTVEGGPQEVGLRIKPDSIEGFNVSMNMLARGLSDVTGENVVDRTGLNGAFDFKLTAPAANEPSTVPAIFKAVPEQLGLKLEAKRGPVEILVIDHVEKASANQ